MFAMLIALSIWIVTAFASFVFPTNCTQHSPERRWTAFRHLVIVHICRESTFQTRPITLFSSSRRTVLSVDGQFRTSGVNTTRPLTGPLSQSASIGLISRSTAKVEPPRVKPSGTPPTETTPQPSMIFFCCVLCHLFLLNEICPDDKSQID